MRLGLCLNASCRGRTGLSLRFSFRFGLGLWFSLRSRLSLGFCLRPRLSLRFSLWPGFGLHPRGRGVFFLGQRLLDSQGSGVTAIGLGVGGLVGPGRGQVLRLEAGRRRMLLVFSRPFRRTGGMLNPAGTAIVGRVMGVGNDAPLDNRAVFVGGVDDIPIHMDDCGVIRKGAAAPLAAGKANASVATAIVDAAVVADVTAPIAAMEPVLAVRPVPVVGRPQRALIGRLDPGAGHPVVVALILIVGPVAGRPHQVGPGANRLHIYRQLRWSEADTDFDLRVRRGGNQREQKRQQEPTREAEDLHRKNLLVLWRPLRCRNRFSLRRARAWVLRSKSTRQPSSRSGQNCTVRFV